MYICTMSVVPDPQCILSLCLCVCIFKDITVLDWSDANLIFANSTCYDATLMGAIAECASK